jgi:YfiH family protein
MSSPFSKFDVFPNLIALFSTKADGSTKIRNTDNQLLDLEHQKNKKIFLEKHDLDDRLMISPFLGHTANVKNVGKMQLGETIKNVDAVITSEPGIILNITVADCLPVYIYDPLNRVIALAHAGWRGLATGVIINTIEKMKDLYKTDPSALVVGIGPSICSKCYEVKEDVAAQFSENCLNHMDGKIFLDLRYAASGQLLALGVNPKNIDINKECTYELADKYFSFRRDKPAMVETMLAVFTMENK